MPYPCSRYRAGPRSALRNRLPLTHIRISSAICSAHADSPARYSASLPTVFCRYSVLCILYSVLCQRSGLLTASPPTLSRLPSLDSQLSTPSSPAQAAYSPPMPPSPPRYPAIFFVLLAQRSLFFLLYTTCTYSAYRNSDNILSLWCRQPRTVRYASLLRSSAE